MQYFINVVADNKQDFLNEKYLLGESSFKVFWAGTGFDRLQKMIQEAPDLLEDITVISDQGKSYSVEEFLDVVKKLKIRIQN